MILDRLLSVRREKGAGFIVLIDPDKLPEGAIERSVETYEDAGADALLVGGSLLHAADFGEYVERLRARTTLPVIGFPGSLSQVTRGLDAVLFLSVISGRNPELLFGQHVYAAPIIRRLGIEPISTGYMIVESGRATTAQYMSGSPPLPRHKPDIAAATALAAEMLGMRLLFADAGSGADEPVPESIVEAVTSCCTAPLIVGGGLRSPRQVASCVQAGAAFVVVGNAIERRPDPCYIAELALAAHVREPRTI